MIFSCYKAELSITVLLTTSHSHTVKFLSLYPRSYLCIDFFLNMIFCVDVEIGVVSRLHMSVYRYVANPE